MFGAVKEKIEERKRVLAHLMTSLEKWRASDRLNAESGTPRSHLLTDEEKELAHAYDLLQNLIGQVQKEKPGGNVDLSC